MRDLSRRHYAALMLPFDENGKIDEAGYRDLIQYFLQERFRSVGGLVANPEAGEIYYLTREEKRRVAEIAVREAAGKMPVFGGVFDLTTEGWVAAPTPQWGLGVPGDAARLICRQVPNIIGWKMIYNYDGQRKMWKMLRSLERHVSIMAAGGGLFHEFLAHDVLDGTVSGSWNYGLEPMLDHIAAWRENDIVKARRIWVEGGLRDLHEFIYSDYSRLHLRYKVAAWLRGLIPNMRPPMPVPKQEEIETTGRLLKAAHIPVAQSSRQFSGRSL